jgi:zinc protease
MPPAAYHLHAPAPDRIDGVTASAEDQPIQQTLDRAMGQRRMIKVQRDEVRRCADAQSGRDAQRLRASRHRRTVKAITGRHARLARQHIALLEAKALAIFEQAQFLCGIDADIGIAADTIDAASVEEGLAALTASMVAEAGSRERKIDEITKSLFPLAGSFSDQVDKEMTTFTGSIHKDKWNEFLDIALPMLLDPGFREEDFRRVKDAQKNALVLDLKDNNEEEFGKERLQANVYAGSGYGHPVLGTVKGIESITLDDVKAFYRQAYTQGAVRVGISGDVSDSMIAALKTELARLPQGGGLPATGVPLGRKPQGLEVEIIEKNTRATAISFGLPLEVTRRHPDFPALWLAKTWLGEHRASSGQLYQRVRELRGLNYGDYAYIEAFPGGMYGFFPRPNLGRKAQLFEVWIRPVAPQNAHFALRLALSELGKLVDNGMSQEDFEVTRGYLMKNVFVMTATQDQRLGYALDSQWYGTPEFTQMMREGLAKLTVADVNAAIRKHLSATNLSVVFITKDAAALKDKLVTDAFSPISYDAKKPQALLDEDQQIGSMKLGIRPEAVRITPAAQAFAQ